MSKIDISWLKNRPIAHRGLHSAKESTPENSLKAFKKAIEKGYTVELDVYVNRKRQVVVFHDESLARMCRYDKSIFSYDANSKVNGGHREYYKLLDTDQRIPTLSDVLKEINNQVPVIIHIRESRFKEKTKFPFIRKKISYKEICKILYDVLYPFRNQIVAVQSFDPIMLRTFAKRLPNVVRGQLSSSFESEKFGRLKKYLLSNYRLNWWSKPHYLAHRFEDSRMSAEFLQKQRKRGVPVLCWTITTPEDHQEAMERFDNVIFEGYLPD